MTERSGYVYALTNATVPGLVKIGVTMRPVSVRASEILRDSGFPQPFKINGYVYAFDIFAAERRIKAAMHNCRYRIGSLTEFYAVPVPKAIEAIVRHSFAGSELYSHWRYEQMHGRADRTLELGEIGTPPMPLIEGKTS